MNEKLETNLRQAAILTFEQLGFMFPMSEDESVQADWEFGTGVQVAFSGPLRGVLSVHTSEELMSTLAGNMLGQDETPSITEQRDALGEVANVICGNLLPLIAGSEAVFDIGAPAPAMCTDGKNDASGGATSRVSILLDSGQADVQLCIL
jgi:CheY-specific phosphatase CheX